MPIYYCQRCEISVDVPEELSLQDKKEFAAVAKRSVILAMDYLRKKGHLSIGQAGVLATHLTSRDRICCRCVTKQDEQEITVCSRCKSLNLNWAD
jgi:hypothetical protein